MTAPGYWMHETSGKLRPVVESLILGTQLTSHEVGIMRAYLAQWMASPWGPEDVVQSLRDRIPGLTSTHDIHEWLEDADEIGIDPL